MVSIRTIIIHFQKGKRKISSALGLAVLLVTTRDVSYTAKQTDSEARRQPAKIMDQNITSMATRTCACVPDKVCPLA